MTSENELTYLLGEQIHDPNTNVMITETSKGRRSTSQSYSLVVFDALNPAPKTKVPMLKLNQKDQEGLKDLNSARLVPQQSLKVESLTCFQDSPDHRKRQSQNFQ